MPYEPTKEWCFVSDCEQIKFKLSFDAMMALKYYRQLKDTDLEAGGNLFSRLEDEDDGIRTLTHISEPSEKDERSRYGFFADRDTERKLIKEYVDIGRYWCGDWHSHPQAVPKPSPLDIESLIDVVDKSNLKELDWMGYYVMLIIGTNTDASGIYGVAYNGEVLKELKCVEGF